MQPQRLKDCDGGRGEAKGSMGMDTLWYIVIGLHTCRKGVVSWRPQQTKPQKEEGKVSGPGMHLPMCGEREL